MRIALALLPLSLFATPALAQPIQLPPELTDPATADKLARSMQALSQAMLDLKVGGVQAAMEGRQPTPAERNLTVGDLVRRDDPQFDRHLQQQIAATRPKIEQSIHALNQALPEITADLQRAHQALQRAIANMPDPNYPRR
jgi:hypothetical protein